jgi:mono/diheme cytochrome c family protein
MIRNFGLTTSIAAAALLAVPACWTAPPDDAGNEAFAAWATVALLGRRAYSHDEVQALAALAASEGREAVVDVLLAQPEFVTYWSRVLWDDLRLAKAESSGLGLELPQDDTCYTKELMPSFHDPALVQHLTYQSWDSEFCPGPVITRGAPAPSGDRTAGALAAVVPVDEATRTAELERLGVGTPRVVASPMRSPVTGGIEFSNRSVESFVTAREQTVSRTNPAIQSCGSFTLADITRAALTEDRLDVLLRAGLVSMSTVNTNQGVAGSKFMGAYLHRDPSCVECHSPHYSTTDPAPRNAEWDRYFPASYVDLEGSAFSFDDAGYHYGGNGGEEVGTRIDGFFRNDAFQDAGGRQPWGIHASCVTQSSRGGYATTIPSGATATLAGLHGTALGPLQLIDQFALGVSVLDLESPDTELAPFPVLGGAPGDAMAGATIVAGCEAGCHAPGNANQAPTDLAAHTKYMTPAKLFDILVTNGSGGGLMPPVLGEDQARDVIAYLASNAAGHVHNRVYTEPAASFAHLTALAIVDAVFEEVAGYSLLLEHGFPRNEDAAVTLELLTKEFVASDWSLKLLLKRIALSDAANRRAPANSLQADRYELPMLFDPWADVNDPTPNTAVGEDANGEGDEVHRYSVASLLLQVHHALQWPEPPLVPPSASSAFADRAFQQEMGAYMNFDNSGFPDLILSALLAWEVEIDRCENPGPNPDYIDALVDPSSGLTVRQAVSALKGRLISDNHLWNGEIVGASDGPIIVIEPPPHESAIVEQALGVDLDDLASDNEDAVRDYCAAVLLSPQFLMGGLAFWDDAHPPLEPDPALPCVDALCTQTDYCEHYRDDAVDLGYGEIKCGLEGPGGFTW